MKDQNLTMKSEQTRAISSCVSGYCGISTERRAVGHGWLASLPCGLPDHGTLITVSAPREPRAERNKKACCTEPLTMVLVKVTEKEQGDIRGVEPNRDRQGLMHSCRGTSPAGWLENKTSVMCTQVSDEEGRFLLVNCDVSKDVANPVRLTMMHEMRGTPTNVKEPKR
ncbi:hypothetical protein IMY05_002G0038500 [Salix suchowensis]|nr:hypothetical protein IMY05_002G0038500 [Salix suchowensis]